MVNSPVTIIRPNGLVEALRPAADRVAPVTYAAPAGRRPRQELDKRDHRRHRANPESWRGRLVDLLC